MPISQRIQGCRLGVHMLVPIWGPVDRLQSPRRGQAASSPAPAQSTLTSRSGTWWCLHPGAEMSPGPGNPIHEPGPWKQSAANLTTRPRAGSRVPFFQVRGVESNFAKKLNPNHPAWWAVCQTPRTQVWGSWGSRGSRWQKELGQVK